MPERSIQDILYEVTIFSKQATDDERWEMDHREGKACNAYGGSSCFRYIFLLINTCKDVQSIIRQIIM